MAEEFDIVAYCESGNATAGICEVNDDLQSVKVGINSFFLIFAVRQLCCVPNNCGIRCAFFRACLHEQFRYFYRYNGSYPLKMNIA